MKPSEQIAFYLVVIFALFAGTWTGTVMAWMTTYQQCAKTGQHKMESFMFIAPLVIECKIVTKEKK